MVKHLGDMGGGSSIDFFNGLVQSIWDGIFSGCGEDEYNEIEQDFDEDEEYIEVDEYDEENGEYIKEEDAETLYSKGLEAFRNSNFEIAIDYFTQAINENAYNEKYFLYRGLSNGSLTNYKNAINDFNEALKLNEELPDAYAGRAMMYDESGEYKKALKDYHIALYEFDSTSYKFVDQNLIINIMKSRYSELSEIYGEKEESPEPSKIYSFLTTNFDEATESLSLKEKNILKYNFGLTGESSKTMAEISELYNIPEKEIQELVNNALSKVINNMPK